MAHSATPMVQLKSLLLLLGFVVPKDSVFAVHSQAQKQRKPQPGLPGLGWVAGSPCYSADSFRDKSKLGHGRG